MAWMPGTSRTQTFSGNSYHSSIDKLVVHTTEGSNWPGYNGGGYAPHFTGKHTGELRQHIDTARSAKALENDSGGVQTNNDGALQAEFIGSCDRDYARRHGLFFWPDATDDDLEPLVRILVWAHAEYDLPLTTRNLVWSDSNAAYEGAPQRMSFAEWRAFSGVCGHQHVPENSHWDPGKMPVERAVQLARARVGAGGVPASDPARPWITSPRVAGFTEAEVTAIQNVLAGFDLDLGSYGVDGSYGDDTGRAVQTLQHELGLTADGVYGPNTEEAVVTIRSDIDYIKRVTVRNQEKIDEGREELDWVRRVTEVNQRRIGTTIDQTAHITRDGKPISLRQEVADGKTIGIANSGSLEDIERALAAADVDTTVPARED